MVERAATGPEEDEEDGGAGHPHRHQHSPHEDDVGPALMCTCCMQGLSTAGGYRDLLVSWLRADSNTAASESEVGCAVKPTIP